VDDTKEESHSSKTGFHPNERKIGARWGPRLEWGTRLKVRLNGAPDLSGPAISLGPLRRPHPRDAMMLTGKRKGAVMRSDLTSAAEQSRSSVTLVTAKPHCMLQARGDYLTSCCPNSYDVNNNVISWIDVVT